MRRQTALILFFSVSLLSAAACSSDRMNAVAFYVPKGQVSERLVSESRIASTTAYGLYRSGQYLRALASYETSLSNLQMIDHEQEIANVRHNMASVHIALGNYRQAQNELDQALEANRRFGFAARVALNLAACGTIAERQKKPDDALAKYLEALRILQANEGAPGDIAQQYNNIGYVLRALKKHDEAIRYFTVGLRFSIPENLYGLIGEAYSGIGECYLALAQPALALTAFTSALNADKASENSLAIAADMKNLGLTDEALGMLPRAVAWFEKAIRINTSLKRLDRALADVDNLIRVQTALKNAVAVAELKRLRREILKVLAVLPNAPT